MLYLIAILCAIALARFIFLKSATKSDVLQTYAEYYISPDTEGYYLGNHPSDDFYSVESVPDILYVHPNVLRVFHRTYNLVDYRDRPWLYGYPVLVDSDSPCPATMQQIVDYSHTKNNLFNQDPTGMYYV